MQTILDYNNNYYTEIIIIIYYVCVTTSPTYQEYIIPVCGTCIAWWVELESDWQKARSMYSFATRSLQKSGEMVIMSCKNCHNFITEKFKKNFLF